MLLPIVYFFLSYYINSLKSMAQAGIVNISVSRIGRKSTVRVNCVDSTTEQKRPSTAPRGRSAFTRRSHPGTNTTEVRNISKD